MKARHVLLSGFSGSFMRLGTIPTNEKGISVKTAHKLGKLLDPVFEEQRRIGKLHEKIIEECVARDDKGEKVKLSERGGEVNYKIDSAKQADYDRMFEDLLELDLELPKVTFKFSEFEKCETLTARDLGAIMEFIEE